MGKNGIIFGSIFACILMLIVPSISAIEFRTVKENMTDYREQPNDLIPVISISGGLGIYIDVSGITDETSIIITLEDAKIRFINRHDYRDSTKIYVAIVDFGAYIFDSFILHISMGNDIYSYQCKSLFFVFAFNFTPIE